jgi:hypothetical protein
MSFYNNLSNREQNWYNFIGFMAIFGGITGFIAIFIAVSNIFKLRNLKKDVDANTAKLDRLDLSNSAVPPGSTLVYGADGWHVVFEASRIFTSGFGVGVSTTLTPAIGFQDDFEVLTNVSGVPLEIKISGASSVHTLLNVEILDSKLDQIFTSSIPWEATISPIQRVFAIDENTLAQNQTYTLILGPAPTQPDFELHDVTIMTTSL